MWTKNPTAVYNLVWPPTPIPNFPQHKPLINPKHQELHTYKPWCKEEPWGTLTVYIVLRHFKDEFWLEMCNSDTQTQYWVQMFNVLTAHLLDAWVVKSLQGGGRGMLDALNFFLFEGLIFHEFSWIFLSISYLIFGRRQQPRLNHCVLMCPKIIHSRGEVTRFRETW